MIRESSLLVARTHVELARYIKPGVTSLALDKKAEEFIRDNGGVPAFKGIMDFLTLYVFHLILKWFMVFLIVIC